VDQVCAAKVKAELKEKKNLTDVEEQVQMRVNQPWRGMVRLLKETING